MKPILSHTVLSRVGLAWVDDVRQPGGLSGRREENDAPSDQFGVYPGASDSEEIHGRGGRRVAAAWPGRASRQRTKELVLICDDPDAPTAEPWVHWVIYKIPADAKGLPEGVPRKAKPKEPAGAVQGKNSWPGGENDRLPRPDAPARPRQSTTTTSSSTPWTRRWRPSRAWTRRPSWRRSAATCWRKAC